MNHVDMLCDLCEETIHFELCEDADRAYARHSKTPYHLEIAETFRSIKLGDHATFSSNFSAFGDAPQNETVTPANLIKLFSVFYCRICQVNLNDSVAMTQHLNSEKHLMLESFVREVNCQRELLKLMGFFLEQTFQIESNEVLSYFSNMNSKGTRMCLVCNRIVFADVNHLLQHMRNDENHVMKLNSLFMNWGEDETFYCIICNVKDTKGALKHCGGNVHRHAIELLYRFARHGMF